jgi:hypothetical protein
LLFGVRPEPEEPQPRVRLPQRVLLDPETQPGRDSPSGRPYLTGHILVGGKSTWLNAALAALLAAHMPQELQITVIDPKMVEFQAYRGLPYLFADVATEVEQAEALLARILAKMDRRRVLFAHAGAKSLAAYNRQACELGKAVLPLLLLAVDEVTDIALQAGLKSAFYKDLIHLNVRQTGGLRRPTGQDLTIPLGCSMLVPCDRECARQRGFYGLSPQGECSVAPHQ